MAHKLYEILERLDSARLWYSLHRVQEDQIMVAVTAVGHRVEIYVSSNGDVGFSRFIGTHSRGAKPEGSGFVSDDLEAILKLIDSEGNGPRQVDVYVKVNYLAGAGGPTAGGPQSP